MSLIDEITERQRATADEFRNDPPGCLEMLVLWALTIVLAFLITWTVTP